MSLLKYWEALGILGSKIARKRDAYFELKEKNTFSALTKRDKKELKNVWGGVKINYKYFKLYKTGNHGFDPMYIPDDLYYSVIDSYFNNPVDCRYIDDKNLYDLFFSDVLQPKTVARKEAGQYLSSSYQLISEHDVISSCQKYSSVIIKKSTKSNGGKSIYFWKNDNSNDSVEKLRLIISQKYDFVIQECIKQHKDIEILHPSSINTIRILTLNWHGRVRVLSSIIRMGVNGNNVDNGHSGGIFCGIEENGRLKNCAYNYMTGHKFENIHPTSRTVFSDCIIPNFNKCKELVCNLAPRLTSFSRLTSWDLSVSVDGEPILIEVNLAYGGVFFHQIANGPVFGDLTKDIINEIIKNK